MKSIVIVIIVVAAVFFASHVEKAWAGDKTEMIPASKAETRSDMSAGMKKDATSAGIATAKTDRGMAPGMTGTASDDQLDHERKTI